MTIDLALLRQWVGRTEERAERIAPFAADALTATLDRDDPPHAEGAPLPPLWHWMHFLPLFPLSGAGYDGHQAVGGFLPPVPLPRRMWAGGRLSFHAPLRVGAMASRVSRVVSVDHRTGRSGDLVFVTVEHSIHADDRLLVQEEHDIVYRAAPAPGEPPREPQRASQASDFSRVVEPGPVLLFRYSALTFNGHRIHYDRPFCLAEGYDGLVVHGPLLATLMLDLLRREQPGAQITGFRFRALAPVTDTAPFTLCGTVEAGMARLWVQRSDGAMAMQGEATLAPA